MPRAIDVPTDQRGAGAPNGKPPNYYWLLWLMIACALLTTAYCAVYLGGAR